MFLDCGEIKTHAEGEHANSNELRPLTNIQTQNFIAARQPCKRQLKIVK